MMEALQNGLYVLSNALLPPVLALLTVMAAWTVALAGGLAREALSRPGQRRAFREAIDLVKAARLDAALKRLRACDSGVPARLARTITDWPADSLDREKCLSDIESDMTVSLSKLSWITRVGPMLGLMGTLIPLGPALTGLASGNIATLSSNLVVAFTATVIGVLVGCIAFTMSLVRRNWYDRDMSDLEFMLTKAAQHSETDAKEKEKVG